MSDILESSKTCGCDCPASTLIVCKGDDMDFSRNRKIYIQVVSKVDLTGLKLHFEFFDYSKTVDVIPESGKIKLAFTAEDTNAFPVGKNYATVWLEDELGKRRSVTKKLVVQVTTSPVVAYSPCVIIV